MKTSHRWKEGFCAICGILKSVAYSNPVMGVVPCGKSAQEWFGPSSLESEVK